MNNNHSDLGKELMVQYLKSERLRILTILTLFFISMLAVPIIQWLNPDIMSMALENQKGYNAFVVTTLLFFVFEIAVFFRVQYMIKRRINPPLNFQYVNTFIEFALVGFILYYTVFYDQSILLMEYDGYDFYILLIILSILHLNWRVNILAGLISALGYGYISYWAFHNLSIPGNYDQMVMIYFARSASLLIFGIMAAVVAKQFGNQIQKAINYKFQRKQAQQVLGQQVSDEIAGEILKTGTNDKPKVADASIMFMDIKDFSIWADTNSPEEVMNYQNSVFCPIIEIINKNHGSINQFLGDGFMASFGISKSNEDYVQSAFNAGLEILDKIEELEKAEIIPKTFIRIGLHRGNIVTGNIGNESRKQFSLAGKNIIIASRLEELNKSLGTQFLISSDIKEKIKEGNYVLEECGLVKMKGIDKKVEVFKVEK